MGCAGSTSVEDPKRAFDSPNIDSNALSRQLAVYGYETQSKLMEMRVLIIGIRGVGIEVAKNLVLAGPKEVRIFDNELVQVEDLGSNFYLSVSDIGNKTRAEASLSQLQQLNVSTKVILETETNIEKIIEHSTCVVVLDNYDRDYLLKLNSTCRDKGIGFIYGGNLGVYGFAFVDFGEEHRVIDSNGEQEKVVHIAGISKEKIGIVYMHEEKRHGLNEGDTVVFSEVKGMVELNGKKEKVSIKSPYAFTIGDTSKFHDYIGGGIAHEVKIPTCLKFKSLERSLKNPYTLESKELQCCSWEDYGKPEKLHVVLNAILEFWTINKRLPNNLDKADFEQLKTTVTNFIAQIPQDQTQEPKEFKVHEIEEDIIKNISLYSKTQISPVCSFWGGIITQEIVKMTGKHSPLHQWLHHEFFSVLPPPEIKRTSEKTRYHDYIILFGDDFIKLAADCTSFIIGSGALGCEFIKMFSLMGLGQKSHLTYVTDDDNIEISNLNRQFLFRKEHVGRNKSEIACSMGGRINEKTNFKSLKLKVSPENEEFFNDDFWNSLSFVVNAVDNIKARQYVDLQCVWYEKALFESGTLGTKCHSQIIIPHKTLSYTDIIDPPEETIPLCTLKNFPYQIEHTIQWARDYFEGIISEPSRELKKFYEEGPIFIESLLKESKINPTLVRTRFEKLKLFYESNELKEYKKCVEMAVNMFYDVFYNQICQLLTAFPENHLVQETGKPFWSGLKRAPKPITLDLNNSLHLEVIQAASNIFANVFNLSPEADCQKIKEVAKSITPNKFEPKNIAIETEENSKKENPKKTEFVEEDELEIKRLSEFFTNVTANKENEPNIVEFEKDDPTNWHIELMGGISNLRARNYEIEEVDNFKVKIIAGKIIPAIATTTAMVVGAVGMEIVKYLLKKEESKFVNLTANLALPLWIMNDPLPPIEITDKEFDPIMCGPIKAIPSKFTKWDKIDIKGPLTLDALKNKVEAEYKIETTMITYGTSTVFSSYGQDSQKRLKMSIVEAIESVSKKPLAKWRKVLPLAISGTGEGGIDCVLPDIRYYI